MTLQEHIDKYGEDIDVSKIKLRLPSEALEAFVEYGGGEPEMYFAGHVMGDVWMSNGPSGMKESRRLFPFPPEVKPSDLLKWEIA